MSDLIHATATGDVVVTTKVAFVHSIILTPAAAKSTVVVRTGGASGTIKASLQAPADGGSAIWSAGSDQGVLFTQGVHITVGGAGALVDVEVSQN